MNENFVVTITPATIPDQAWDYYSAWTKLLTAKLLINDALIKMSNQENQNLDLDEQIKSFSKEAINALQELAEGKF